MNWKEIADISKLSNKNLNAQYQEFTRSNSGWGDVLREKLHSSERWLVVQIMIELNESQYKEVFDITVWFACGGATDREVLLFRKIILEMDREWVEKRIVNEVIGVVQIENEDFNYYSAFGLLVSLELFEEANLITKMALNHDDPNVREAGEECKRFLIDPKAESVKKFISQCYSFDPNSMKRQ